jgi:hypothetical protein
MIMIGCYVPEERVKEELEELCDLLQSSFDIINRNHYIIITGHLYSVFPTFI